MKLFELCDLCSTMLAEGNGNAEVVITISEPSIGSRAKVGIDSIYPGFDWEHGQIRIESEKPIVLKK